MSHDQFGTESPVAGCKCKSQKTFVGPNVGQGRKKVRFKDLNENDWEGHDSGQDPKDLEKSQKKSQKRSQKLLGRND